MRHWFTNDVGWKLFSVILAVGIWITVHQILGGGENPVALVVGEKQATYQNIAVLVVSSAADVRQFRVLPDMVSVTVSGSVTTLTALQPDQIRAVVDLTGIESAKELSRPVDVSLPPGQRLVSVNPNSVSVLVPAAQRKS